MEHALVCDASWLWTHHAAPSTAFQLDNKKLFDGLCASDLKQRKDRLWELSEIIKLDLESLLASMSKRGLEKVESIRRSDVEPRKVIGVRGGAAFGKSSMINALLDLDRLVPTSPVESTTAVVTEIAYHDSDDYAACVEFISKDEWRKEVSSIKDQWARFEFPPKRSGPRSYLRHLALDESMGSRVWTVWQA